MTQAVAKKRQAITQERVDKFVSRKEKNKEKVASRNYEITERSNGKPLLIKKNSKGEIIGTPCTYCLEHIKASPYSYGAYILPLCKQCFMDCEYIEPYLEGKKGGTIKSKKNRSNTIESANIDWDYVKRLIDKGEAKAGLLREKYRVDYGELKQAIVERFSDYDVEFRKGRGGGIHLIKKEQNNAKK